LSLARPGTINIDYPWSRLGDECTTASTITQIDS